MSDDNLEEEIETLELAYNNVDNVIMSLRDLSSDQYGYIISRCQELLNDIDYILIDKQECFDKYSMQLTESHFEDFENKYLE